MRHMFQARRHRLPMAGNAPVFSMKPILSRMFTALLLLAHAACGDSMLQYFNTSWAEITRKMPELAEAGYQSLWLPPPAKGSGGLSVGYDLWDPFDLGSKDQRGSVATRYGTEAELLELVATAHRFGIRIYFDNIMNHRAFDVPGYNENTPIDIYPGMVPGRPGACTRALAVLTGHAVSTSDGRESLGLGPQPRRMCAKPALGHEPEKRVRKSGYRPWAELSSAPVARGG